MDSPTSIATSGRGPTQGEILVAVGGGSVLDTAKALMVGTADGSFEALIALLATGKPFAPHRIKPLIAIPTTAGHRQRGHALGDDLGPRRRQEVFAAP